MKKENNTPKLTIASHTEFICKWSIKEKQCQYILHGQTGFECWKLHPFGKTLAKENRPYASGDNCEGIDLNKSRKVLNL